MGKLILTKAVRRTDSGAVDTRRSEGCKQTGMCTGVACNMVHGGLGQTQLLAEQLFVTAPAVRPSKAAYRLQ